MCYIARPAEYLDQDFSAFGKIDQLYLNINEKNDLTAFVNQVFNENRFIVMLKSAWVVVNFWFPLNNFSLLWPIDTKFAVWAAYIKRQLGIATQVSVINN